MLGWKTHIRMLVGALLGVAIPLVAVGWLWLTFGPIRMVDSTIYTVAPERYIQFGPWQRESSEAVRVGCDGQKTPVVRERRTGVVPGYFFDAHVAQVVEVEEDGKIWEEPPRSTGIVYRKDRIAFWAVLIEVVGAGLFYLLGWRLHPRWG